MRTHQYQVPYWVTKVLVFFIVMSVSLGLSSSTITPRKVAIIGATGKLGREAVTKLCSKGIPVKCLVRSDPAPDFLTDRPSVELVKGDVTNVDSLKILLEGCTDCLALYGATRRSKLSDIFHNGKAELEPSHAKMVNYEGVRNTVQAAEESKTCKRIVRITGKGEDPWSFFSILINMLGSFAKGWNYEGEQVLRTCSSVDYTIIRPGIMKSDQDFTSTTFQGNDSKKILALRDNGQDLKVSAVSYGAIADLCIECLDYPNAARSTLTAMTVPPGQGEETYAPLLARVRPDTREYPASLIQEHKRAVRTALVSILVAISSVIVAIILNIRTR